MTVTIVDQLAESIARMEGFYKPGSIAARNNNPGNLRTWGNNPVASGYAQFSTPAAGWAALRQQITKNVARSLTLNEFFAGKPGVYPGYSPAADSNDPANYARFVAARLGVSADTPLPQLVQPRASQSSAWPELPAAPATASQLPLYAALAVGAVALAWLLKD